MDERGIPQKEVERLLAKAHAKDQSYQRGRILGSMCTTPHELAIRAFTDFMDTNLGDAGLFKGTKELEEGAVSMMADLTGMQGGNGLIVSGGTEANILAMWAARNKLKKKKVIVPETAHFSFDKACDLLGMELVRAEVDQDKQVDIGDVESKVDGDTCAIVGVAGTTEYGTVDDISSLARIADENNIHLHVDAAFGGFVLPFLKELGYPVDFDLSRDVPDSITIDPHKMGLVPIPCGCIIFRDKGTLHFIETQTPYLSQTSQHTLLGTRTGGSAASAIAVFKLLGRAGYRSIVKACMDNTHRLYREISELGYIVREPTMNILVFRAEEAVTKELIKRGWHLSKTREGEVRIILMPHVTEAIVEEFIADLRIISGGSR